MRRTFREEWEEYRSRVVPWNAGEVQAKETCMAFYAGAISLMHLLDSIASAPANPTQLEMDTDYLQQLYDEIIDEIIARCQTFPGGAP